MGSPQESDFFWMDPEGEYACALPGSQRTALSHLLLGALRGWVRPLLFDAFPLLAESTAWTPLAHVPTAIEPCDAVGPWLGRSSGIFMKRDDEISPLYGGNEVRR